MTPLNAISSRVRSLGLLGSFGLLSFVCITVTTAVSASIVMGFISDHLMERDAAITTHFIQSVADIERLDDELHRPRALQSEEGFGEFFRHVGNMPDVVGAVVYAPDRTVLWASDQRLVGARFEHNDELEKALLGETVFEFIGKRERGKEEHTQILPEVNAVVENYLPIRDDTRGNVIAVAEIYKVPRALFEALAEGRRLVWLSAAGSGLFLWLALYWIVRRAANLIQRQQARLLEAERYSAVGEMATAVAHGIRNPLASIRSSAELALEADSLQVGKDTATDIIAEADRLEQWVKELLLGSRLEDTSIDKVRLDVLAEEHLSKLAGRLERQNVKLVLDLGETLPIRGDAPLLRQMLDNLVSNALEAMPSGGTLTVATSTSSDRRETRLVVSDTGTGIAPEIASKVFKPLFTSKRNGLGLGLALVKRIVERHGGDIELSSASGAGTTARLRFRMARR